MHILITHIFFYVSSRCFTLPYQIDFLIDCLIQNVTVLILSISGFQRQIAIVK